jgi:pyrroloquinoline quinone biosynthesis protein B
MRWRLLGTAAGGGLPQWNCACRNCESARLRGERRLQASAAVSGDGERWYLVHATPDVHAQIASFPPLWPKPPRRSPLKGVLLANADLDACLGLLSLREAAELSVFATGAVLDAVRSSGFTAQMRAAWRPLRLGEWVRLDENLELRAMMAPGKAPLYFQGPTSPEHNVALFIRRGRRTAAWLPTLAEPTEELEGALRGVDVLFFDGTVWSDEELVHVGRTAREMAHWPLSESLPWLSQLGARRILVHINNTNPILEQDLLGDVEIGCDGMEVLLE